MYFIKLAILVFGCPRDRYITNFTRKPHQFSLKKTWCRSKREQDPYIGPHGTDEKQSNFEFKIFQIENTRQILGSWVLGGVGLMVGGVNRQRGAHLSFLPPPHQKVGRGRRQKFFLIVFYQV